MRFMCVILVCTQIHHFGLSLTEIEQNVVLSLIEFLHLDQCILSGQLDSSALSGLKHMSHRFVMSTFIVLDDLLEYFTSEVFVDEQTAVVLKVEDLGVMAEMFEKVIKYNMCL